MIYTRRAKTIILLFLQDAFSQPELFGDEGNEFLWSADETQSKIIIADSYTEDLESIDVRPAIILSRGPVSFMNIGLNQQVGFDPKNNTATYQDNLKTSIRINCFSRTGLQAETIASAVFSIIQFFADSLRQRGAFEINSLSIGEESIVQSDSQVELSVVPVEIGLYMFDKWVLQNPGNEAVTVRHDATGVVITDNNNIERIIKT